MNKIDHYKFLKAESDIYDAAQSIIEKCSSHYDPKTYANFWSQKLDEDGDAEGATSWTKIANAVEDILNGKPRGKAH